MSAIDALLPHRPLTVTLNLPFPPSVNRIWRRGKKAGMYLSPEYRAWQRNANGYILMQKPLLRIAVPFEAQILLNSEAGQGDVDNRIKCVLDYAQRIEIIENDKLCIKVTAEWVKPAQAPYGCRLILRERDR